MKNFYATLSTNQGGPGYIRIEAPDMACARQDMFDVVGERFCTVYNSLEQLHPLDRQELGHISKTESRISIRVELCREP